MRNGPRAHVFGSCAHIHTKFACSPKIVCSLLSIGPSGVRAMPLAAGTYEGGHYFRYFFGPSGVRALPVAAGTNEGGHYFRYFFHIFLFLLLLPLLFPQKGVS